MDDRSAVSSRLAAAIRRWGGPRAVAAFSRAMEERGAKGATRTTVHQFLRGEGEPSLAFVRIAAEVLGVTPAWLAFGTGPATAEEERVQEEVVRWALKGALPLGALTEAREQAEDELLVHLGGDDGEA